MWEIDTRQQNEEKKDDIALTASDIEEEEEDREQIIAEEPQLNVTSFKPMKDEQTGSMSLNLSKSPNLEEVKEGDFSGVKEHQIDVSSLYNCPDVLNSDQDEFNYYNEDLKLEDQNMEIDLSGLNVYGSLLE